MNPHAKIARNGLAALLSLVLSLPAYGRSTEEQITPKTLDIGRFVFAVSTSPAKDGGVAFDVTIATKKGDMPSNLSVYFETYQAREDGATSEGGRNDIPMTVTKKHQIWKVEFVLPAALLKETDIRLVFSQNYEMAADMYEITPQDFLKK